MKKYIFSLSALCALAEALALAAGLAIALSACHHETPANATLTLGFGKSSASTSARSFAPVEIAIASILVEATGPGGAKVQVSSTDFAPVQLDLIPGSWLVTGKGMNANGIEVASGFLELSLGPSESMTKDLLLAPVVGDGSIALSWTIAGSVEGSLSVAGSLSSSAGSTLPISASTVTAGGGPLRFEALHSGSWKLELRLLRDGAALCGLADALLVAAGMETKATVAFKPPEASLSLAFALPDYTALGFQVEPSLRHVSRGTEIAFRAPLSGELSWYEEGTLLSGSRAELRYVPGGASGVRRIDCVQGGALPRSGTAQARLSEAQSLGPLNWGEIVDKAAGSARAQAALRGLGDCRDLAWSPDGAFLAAVGKSANCLSVLEVSAPGAVFASCSLGGAAEPRLVSPSVVRFLPGGSLLALSEAEGAVYGVSAPSAAGATALLSLTACLKDPCLAGAKDLAPTPEASAAYAAASGADAIALIGLDAVGRPVSTRTAAVKGAPGLEAFSRPNCLALSPTGRLLAVGTAGDDAIYFFDRDPGTDALAFRSRLDQSSFPAVAPLSDPCSLAFSPDGASLFVLSYYGKALVRLDFDAVSGAYAICASARSGQGGVSGFAYPKRLSLSPDGKLLAVVGGGSEDGLSLFDIAGSTKLSYLGSLMPSAGKAVPSKPSALGFSPDSRYVAVAADGVLSFFTIMRNL